jgi:hypothetical protein
VPSRPCVGLRYGTIAGDQLDQIGLAAGGGFLKHTVLMCSDRGLGDAEHLGDLGHAIISMMEKARAIPPGLAEIPGLWRGYCGRFR